MNTLGGVSYFVFKEQRKVSENILDNNALNQCSSNTTAPMLPPCAVPYAYLVNTLRLVDDDSSHKCVQTPELLLEADHLGIAVEDVLLSRPNILSRRVIVNLRRSAVYHRDES